MENTVFVLHYNPDITPLPVNLAEVRRYAGYPRGAALSPEMEQLLNQTAAEAAACCTYKICYRRMPLPWQNGQPVLPFPCEAKSLAGWLRGSREVVLFAATLGLELDRKIAKYQRISPTKALFLQAAGAERVEALCDAFCRDIASEAAAEGLHAGRRFSPGYGDFPLETQRALFQLLDCNRKIGLSLNESLLMTPSKSVTALFGLGDCSAAAERNKCRRCAKFDCQFRENTPQENIP